MPYTIEFAPTGVGCRVLRDGEPVEKVTRVAVEAEVGMPTRLEIEQAGEPVTVTGEFGRVETHHRHELTTALSEIARDMGCPRKVS